MNALKEVEYGLEVDNLSFFYGQREILHQVSFRIETGKLVCLLGPNGVGKSRLFRTILRMLPDYTGQIRIAGQNTANLDYGNQIRVLEQGKDLTSRGYTILMAIHQPDQAFLFADEVLALKDGCLIAQGTPREVITREFMKSLYKTDVQIESLADDRMRVCVPMVLLRGDR